MPGRARSAGGPAGASTGGRSGRSSRSRARAAAPSAAARPRVKVWVVFGDGAKFGDGRAALLEGIAELGSFRKAVGRFGMSYRSAWGYFRELERAAGINFLERHPGGGPGGGTRLTAEGRRFLARYRAFRRGLDALARRQFARSFGRRRPR